MLQSILALLEHNPGGHQFQFDIRFNESLISRVRNAQATAFLATDADYLLSIDADLSFPSDAVARLVRHDLDIVGAPYVSKKFPPRWLVYFPDQVPSYVAGVMEVKYAPTGFLLVKRSVFERLVDHCPSYLTNGVRQHGFYLPFIHDDLYQGEDYAFCQRARERGFKINVDFDLELKHYGITPLWMKERVGYAGSDNALASITHGIEDLVGRINRIQQLAP